MVPGFGTMSRITESDSKQTNLEPLGIFLPFIVFRNSSYVKFGRNLSLTHVGTSTRWLLLPRGRKSLIPKLKTQGSKVIGIGDITEETTNGSLLHGLRTLSCTRREGTPGVYNTRDNSGSKLSFLTVDSHLSC